MCRHRGSRICDPETQGHAKGAIKCPYHAWSYSYDGQLIGTPLVGEDELDRSTLSLWPVRVDVWQGFVFVHLGEPEEGVARVVRAPERQAAPVRALADGRAAHRRTRRSTELAANWKILVENYNECLHCPTVHPELVAVAPTFRKGLVFEEGRDDWGVSMEGAGYTATGTTTIPVMPGLDRAAGERDARREHLPEHVPRPDRHGRDRDADAAARPRSTRRSSPTTCSGPRSIADPGFDPSETVEFSELVAHQDYVVCERVQQGVRSRAFSHGVYAEKDELPYRFNQRYLAARDRP